MQAQTNAQSSALPAAFLALLPGPLAAPLTLTLKDKIDLVGIRGDARCALTPSAFPSSAPSP